MRLRLRLAVVAVMVFTMFTAALAASEGESTKKVTKVTRHFRGKNCSAIQLTKIKHRIYEYRKRTEKARSLLGVKHYKYSRQPIIGCGYAAWVRDIWWRRVKTHDTYLNMLRHSDRDFFAAGHLAVKVFRTSYARLYYRAGAEGGHSEWICNRQGSGACGWFQFMSGTYYAYSSSAFRLARQRGYPIPESYNKWTSLLGQNLTAAYMFELGLECSGVGWAASC